MLAMLLAAATPADLGLDHELWITCRHDGQVGRGTLDDPFDGSTQERFDAVLNHLYATNTTHVTIHLGPGTFPTMGSYVYVAYNPKPGWFLDDGWQIIGAGMGNTVLKLVGLTYEDPGPNKVTVADGQWTLAGDHWLEPGQEIRLVSGSGLTSLALGQVYYVAEVTDARHFRVSATLGGPPLAAAAIAKNGVLRVINRDTGNTAIVNRAWNRQDISVRDLTIDCNWPGLGTTTTEPFTVPAEQETVTVTVASTAWAVPNRRVYLAEPNARPVGVYDLLAVVDAHHLKLRNATNHHAPAPGAPDLRFRSNRRAGIEIDAGTLIGPRGNFAGIGLSAARCQIERVRVINGAAPVYEGNCGINVVGVGAPGPKWPEVSDVVIRDCVVENYWGEYGWPLQICGNNTDVPSKGYGAQALVEGNTIRGNGLYQGLGGWNYCHSFFINNKVINCATAFFTDTANCWDNVVRDNLFLGCSSYPILLGGGPDLWRADAAYHKGDLIYLDDVSYTCATDHKGQKPPNEAYWTETARPACRPWDGYVFENNLIETTGTSPILFNGNVSNTVFRNNVIRCAPGQTRPKCGLNFARPTNRGLIVVGNVIDSRLKNEVGEAIMFGRDNLDETGKLRPELEKH
jgi:hypothetical protein